MNAVIGQTIFVCKCSSFDAFICFPDRNKDQEQFLLIHSQEDGKSNRARSWKPTKIQSTEFFSSTLFLTRNISYYGQSILSTEKIICENFMYFMHHWYGLVISISYTVAAHVQNLWIGNSKAGRISKLSEEPKNCLKNNTHIFIRRSSKIIRT